MDFVWICTLIILHQVASYLCKPLTTLSNVEDKAIMSENYTDIVNLIKDIKEHRENNDETRLPNFEDRKSILHMIQLIRKDGSKAPVAIILTPADLAAGSANKNDLLNRYEDRQIRKDNENQMKSSEETVEMNSENDNIYFTKDESQNILNDDVESSISKNVQQDQVAQDIDTHMKNLNETWKEDSKTDNPLESELTTNASPLVVNLDLDNLLITSTNKENLEVITAKEDNNENEVKHEDYYHNKLENEERNLQTEIPVKLNENDDTTEYFENKKATSVEDVTKETLTSENDEKNSKTRIDSQQNTNDLESRIDETENPKVYFFEDDQLTEVNSGCENKRKTSFVDKDCKPDKRIYNLSFIFNRK